MTIARKSKSSQVSRDARQPRGAVKSVGTGKNDPTLRDFKKLEAWTDNQDLYIQAFEEGKNVVAVGSAGTGKTYLAVGLALGEIIAGRATKIKIVRSAVQARDQGFLPGDDVEKMAVYEEPYRDAVNEHLGKGDAYEILKKKGVIEFASTSFLRGTTYRNTIIIGDEIQNYNPGEINTLATRLGSGSRLLLNGDMVQCDLPLEDSGYDFLMQVVPHMQNRFAIIAMTRDDIVRDGFVKDWIIACEDHSDFYDQRR